MENKKIVEYYPSKENISNKHLIPIWFSKNEFALVTEEALNETAKQINEMINLTTDPITIKLYSKDCQLRIPELDKFKGEVFSKFEYYDERRKKE